MTYSVSNGVATLDKTTTDALAASLREASGGGFAVDLTAGVGGAQSVILPAGWIDCAAQAFADGGNNLARLTLRLSSGAIELDMDALAELARQADGRELRISLSEVSVESLSDAQREAVAEIGAEKVFSIHRIVVRGC